MSVVKVAKPKRLTSRVKHLYLVHPMGQLLNGNLFGLFENFGVILNDDDIERLRLPGGIVPAWPITRDMMFQLYRSKEYHFGQDYRLFRKNPDTGAVTTVPERDLQGVRNDPVVKAARQALGAIVTAKKKAKAAVGI